MYVIHYFLTIKRLHIRFCALVFLVLLVAFVYAVDVDAADASVNGAVDHIDSMAGAGIGIYGPLALAPSARS